jgi:hypothetical protein
VNAHHGQKDRISGGYLNSRYVGYPFGHADASLPKAAAMTNGFRYVMFSSFVCRRVANSSPYAAVHCPSRAQIGF